MKIVENDIYKISVKKDQMSSTLTISDAGQRQSGNYTCSPEKMKNATVSVVVIVGKTRDFSIVK